MKKKIKKEGRDGGNREKRRGRKQRTSYSYLPSPRNNLLTVDILDTL